MAKFRFFEIFLENPDGSLSPVRPIIVNGVRFGRGVSFGPGVSFGGVDFHRYKNLDIVAEQQGEELIIQGFSQPGV